MRDHAMHQTAHQSLVTDESTLEQLIAHSHQEPVWLFNHDPWCGISAAAWEELEQLDVRVNVIDVARYHNLRTLVAARTGVRHQSPQIILLQGGRAVWSASHFRVTAKNVRQTLAAQTGQADGASGPETESAERPWWRI
ncbi:MAG TPA: monothiol bacilliredoxin BrxC family protein, partial [Chloroflexota bacterium]|nr:monothiol bacilliredoxin BrxC family protein [Chloroflexota bacterium]